MSSLVRGKRGCHLQSTRGCPFPVIKLQRGAAQTRNGQGQLQSRSIALPKGIDLLSNTLTMTTFPSSNNRATTSSNRKRRATTPSRPRDANRCWDWGRFCRPPNPKVCRLVPPPKFLTYSIGSLSSSTCSSSSSTRYSDSPSPGIQDQYNSPLQWPFAAANVSPNLFLEEMCEEGLDDVDEWSADWSSPT